jgi:hypothetical protein
MQAARARERQQEIEARGLGWINLSGCYAVAS